MVMGGSVVPVDAKAVGPGQGDGLTASDHDGVVRSIRGHCRGSWSVGDAASQGVYSIANAILRASGVAFGFAFPFYDFAVNRFGMGGATLLVLMSFVYSLLVD
jgi:hypothetical protein